MFRKFLIKKDERGLLFRKGDFVTVLHAGEHRYFDPFCRLTVEKYPLAKTAFDHRLADYLRHAEPALIDSEFHVVEVGQTEVGCALKMVCSSKSLRRTHTACTGRATLTCALRASKSAKTSCCRIA